MKTISLDQFRNLLSDSYAVCMNDTLYYVDFDMENNPYIATNVYGDYFELFMIDSDIQFDDYAVFFYIQDQPIRMMFLTIKEFKIDSSS